MDRKTILSMDFDWRDEDSFQKALNDPSLSKNDINELKAKRLHLLELEELKSDSKDYEDYDEDFDDEEEQEAHRDEKARQAADKRRNAPKKGGAVPVIVPVTHIITAFAMCLFMVVLPFITYLHEEPLTDLTVKYYNGDNGNMVEDWFLFQKEFFVVLAGLMLAAFLVVDRFFTEKPSKALPLGKKNLRLPLFLCGAYAVLLILSGIMSENKEVVLMGVVKHYEGLLGVLAYLVIFVSGMCWFYNRRALRYFMTAMLLLSGLAGLLGVLEYMGYPLIDMGFFEHLMAPSDRLSDAQALHSASGNVHITFFNSNYFGGFCGLMFPVCAALALGAKETAVKLAGGFFTALLAICAVLSNSSGGLYSVVGSCVVFALIYLIYWVRKLVDRKKALIAAAVVAVAAAGGFGYMAAKNDDFISRIKEVVNNGSTPEEEAENREYKKQTHFLLTDIKAKGRSLFLYSDDLCLEMEGYYDEEGVAQVRFFDGDRQELKTLYYEQEYYFYDERYKRCTFKFSVSDKLYCDLGYDAKLIFQFDESGFKPFVHGVYTMDHINHFEGPEIFKEHLSFATGRGFIWGSTLPMLKDHILLGYGSGNYVMNFPQYDYVSLLEVYDTPAMVVNKPHSWYLGIACDSGVISLIVVLVLLGAFVLRGIKKCIISPVKDDYMHLRTGLFVSVLAFMAVGIVNDSYVCVSPVFWFIFGVAWFMMSGREIVDNE